MPEVFLGWDVGAWHCERNAKSRDALCALTLGEDGNPVLLGTPWRGNLREQIGGKADPVSEMFRCLKVELPTQGGITIAIDAALGWPREFRHLLLNDEAPGLIGDRPFENGLLYRETDRVLKKSGYRPLSVVQDMISSQSTKAMTFLVRAGLTSTSIGIWERGGGGAPRVTAIETYPAPAECSVSCSGLKASLMSDERFVGTLKGKDSVDKDLRDALVCAVISYLFSKQRNRLLAPEDSPNAVPKEEGWIWLPQDCYAPGTS
jgi:hypothetical protein